MAYEVQLKRYEQFASSYNFKIHTSRTIGSGLSRLLGAVEQDNPYHLVIMGLLFGNDAQNGINRGKQLALKIRLHSPTTKIAIITSITNSYRIIEVMARLNPEGLFLKSELKPDRFAENLVKILEGKTFYSDAVNTLIHQDRKFVRKLDLIDRKLLYLLSIGAKTVDLPQELNLSISGVEKRKRKIAQILQLESASAKVLIAAAKKLNLV